MSSSLTGRTGTHVQSLGDESVRGYLLTLLCTKVCNMSKRKVVTITAVTESISPQGNQVVWLHMNRDDFYIKEPLVVNVPSAFWRIAQVHSALYPSEPPLKVQEGNTIDFDTWVGKRVRIVQNYKTGMDRVHKFEKPYSNYPKAIKI